MIVYTFAGMDIDQLYQLFLRHPSVQTDTRKLKKGDIFFALKGPNFNGNHFAKQALEAGAAYVVADETPAFKDERILLTDHALITLQQLAGYHRRQFSIPFIAITGSNGKTTTKELVHAVLSSTYKTYTTRGNLNNHIGIPLTLLSVKPDAEMAIIEMGANHLKEIAGYCEYTRPTHGIITNCGKAHLEGFGSIEGVRKAKGELYDYLKQHEGTAFIMWDYDYLREMSRGIPHMITYGTSGAEVTGNIRQADPFLEVAMTKDKEKIIIQSKLVGDYNLPNILAAVAAGRYFNVPENKIKTAIEAYAPSNSRSQLIEREGNKIILDAYNANPSSMKAAIENFAATQNTNKILVLGAMMELGRESEKEHSDLVELVTHYLWKEVILVGGDFARIKHPFRFFNTAPEAGAWLREHREKGNVYLVKGSRSIQMEVIADML